METVLTRQDLKIRKTVNFIETTTGKAIGNAMLAIGEHLIDQYFVDDMGIRTKESKAIINTLMEALDGRVPMSQSSIYKCLALAKLKRRFPHMKGFWDIGHSQRIALLPLRDNPQALESAAIECYKDKLTFKEATQMVREEINLLPRDSRGRKRHTKARILASTLSKASKDVIITGAFKECTENDIKALKKAAEALEKKLERIKRQIERFESRR